MKKKIFELIDNSIHYPVPKVVFLTNPTEYGTIYSKEEIREITEHAHSKEMRVHLDGARLYNAAAEKGWSLKECTRDLGVDSLSLGGTKNGLLFGEAVIFFNEDQAKGFERIVKQGMQLGSKMRFIGCQFTEMLSADL